MSPLEKTPLNTVVFPGFQESSWFMGNLFFGLQISMLDACRNGRMVSKVKREARLR